MYIKNKSKKVVKKIYILGIFYIYILSSSIVFARGGGGGSSGGGGEGGSSGGSSGTGGVGGVLGIVQFIFYVIIIFTMIAIPWYIKKQKIKKATMLLKKAELQDPSWREDGLKKKVSEIFLKFQEDWSNFNIERMKGYLTEEYYKRMVLEMNVLKNENRQNSMEEVIINSLNLLEIVDEADNTKDSFTIEVNAQAVDSLNDLTNNHLLYRDTNPFTEYWNFVRQGGDWKLNLIKQSTEDEQEIEKDIVDFAKNNNFYYDPDFGWLMMPNKGVIFSSSNFETSDINNHVVGYFKDKIVEFYTFIPNKETKNPTNYIVAQMVLPIRYNNIVVRKKRWLFNFSPSGLRRIKTESNDFDKKFCIWADPADQVSSFELLSPNFMEKIYDLPFELNIEVVGNFLYFYSKERSSISYDKMLEVLSWAFDEMKM